jgi:hypothetical protein
MPLPCKLLGDRVRVTGTPRTTSNIRRADLAERYILKRKVLTRLCLLDLRDPMKTRFYSSVLAYRPGRTATNIASHYPTAVLPPNIRNIAQQIPASATRARVPCHGWQNIRKSTLWAHKTRVSDPHRPPARQRPPCSNTAARTNRSSKPSCVRATGLGRFPFQPLEGKAAQTPRITVVVNRGANNDGVQNVGMARRMRSKTLLG